MIINTCITETTVDDFTSGLAGNWSPVPIDAMGNVRQFGCTLPFNAKTCAALVATVAREQSMVTVEGLFTQSCDAPYLLVMNILSARGNQSRK
jgi:hypothetical protein